MATVKAHGDGQNAPGSLGTNGMKSLRSLRRTSGNDQRVEAQWPGEWVVMAVVDPPISSIVSGDETPVDHLEFHYRAGRRSTGMELVPVRGPGAMEGRRWS